MHTANYKFSMKPKESVECHQTLSLWVGSGSRVATPHSAREEGNLPLQPSLVPMPRPAFRRWAGPGTRLTAANLLHRNSFTHALRICASSCLWFPS